MRRVRWIAVRLGPWIAVGFTLSLLWWWQRNTLVVDPQLLAVQASLPHVDRQLREFDELLGMVSSRVSLALLDERAELRPVLVSSLLQRLTTKGERNRGRLELAVSELRRILDAAGPRLAGRRYARRLDRHLPQMLQLYGEYLSNLGHLLELVEADPDAEALRLSGIVMEKAHSRVHVRLRYMMRIVAGWNRDVADELARGLRHPSASERLPGLLVVWALLLVAAALSLLAWRPFGQLVLVARSFGEQLGGPRPRSVHGPVKAVQEVLRTALDELSRRDKRIAALDGRLADEQIATRRGAQELALLRLYNDTLVDNIRHGLLVTNAALRLSFANHAARQLLGLTDADQGRDLAAVSAWQRLARRYDLRAALERAMAERQVSRREALELGSDDQQRYCDLVISPYLDETGQARGVLILLEDVSESVRIRNRLLATERLATIGRLAAMVAHEVRNPLSAIGLNVDLLQDEISPDNQEARTLFTSIAAEVERLTGVTEHYLELARLPGPQAEVCDLNRVVEGTLTFVAEDLRSRNVNVHIRLADQPMLVSIDEGQMRQALLNIIRNTWEALPKGGRLDVSTSHVDGRVFLRFQDDGPGIPPEACGSIFDPFFTTKEGGTGLGLSITAQIVRENDGRIEYDNQSSQPGAAFVMSFPAA